MKYLILLSTFLAFSAHAWEPVQRYDGQYLSNDEVFYGGLGLEPYSAYDGVQSTHRNVFGGEDYYGTRGYMGSSIPNVHGGRDFYPAPTVGW